MKGKASVSEEGSQAFYQNGNNTLEVLAEISIGTQQLALMVAFLLTLFVKLTI
jgi:hypothetical protein